MDRAAPFFSRFPSRRSVVYSNRGVVACSQPLAAQAGLEVLKAGGNAVDAAVATAAALGVTEPCSTGLGGDMFMLYWNERQGKVHAMNGSGRSPSALTIEKCRTMGFMGRLIPAQTVNTVTVPGQVAGWVDAVERHGSGKVSMAQVLQPSITLCEDGFPVSEVTAKQWVECENLIRQSSPNGHELLKDGKAPMAGQVFKNPYLGKVLREIASEGKAGFYEGWVADAIVGVIKDLGGVMTRGDLKRHTSTHDEPISLSYGDVTLWECPPNGQGIIALQALGIIDQLEKSGKISPLGHLGHNSAEYVHVMIEALRYAFADSEAFVADPEHANLPLNELLSPKYLAERARNFRQDAADDSVRNGNPTQSSDTVYLVTSDSEGNACSFICSIAATFGTGIIPKGCGFALQSRGGHYHLDENHFNALKPNKRSYHTIMPAMVTKGNKLEMAYGVMGGFMQPQGHLQVLFNTHVFGFNPQDALDAPRICIRPALGCRDYATTADTSALSKRSIVQLEEGVPSHVVDRLRSMGHQVEVVAGWERAVFGRGQVIHTYRDPNGGLVYRAGSDLRADGHAVPW